jgi:hypothetical protein
VGSLIKVDRAGSDQARTASPDFSRRVIEFVAFLRVAGGQRVIAQIGVVGFEVAAVFLGGFWAFKNPRIG